MQNLKYIILFLLDDKNKGMFYRATKNLENTFGTWHSAAVKTKDFLGVFKKIVKIYEHKQYSRIYTFQQISSSSDFVQVKFKKNERTKKYNRVCVGIRSV